MTALKEQLVETIKEIPDDKIIYIAEIIKSIQGYSKETPKENITNSKLEAFKELEKLIKPFPSDFDYDKELESAREEKYGHIG